MAAGAHVTPFAGAFGEKTARNQPGSFSSEKQSGGKRPLADIAGAELTSFSQENREDMAMEFPKGVLDLYLTDIGEPLDNQLRIVVTEGMLGEPEEIDIGGVAVGKGRPVIMTDESRSFSSFTGTTTLPT